MYLFTYDDEGEENIVTKTFESKPSVRELENLMYDVDTRCQSDCMRELLKADGEYVHFTTEDDDGYVTGGYYARLCKVE